FNSATAVMPWGTSARMVSRNTNVRFNSATAVMPWGTSTTISSVSVIGRFNSATAVMPWGTNLDGANLDGARLLQFGHGGDAVGYSRSSGRNTHAARRFNS